MVCLCSKQLSTSRCISMICFDKAKRLINVQWVFPKRTKNANVTLCLTNIMLCILRFFSHHPKEEQESEPLFFTGLPHPEDASVPNIPDQHPPQQEETEGQ